jgi:hypothetical protein
MDHIQDARVWYGDPRVLTDDDLFRRYELAIRKGNTAKMRQANKEWNRRHGRPPLYIPYKSFGDGYREYVYREDEKQLETEKKRLEEIRKRRNKRKVYTV